MRVSCVNLSTSFTNIFGGNRHFEFPTSNRNLSRLDVFTSLIMSEYFKYLRQMLSIAGESFEDELRRLVSLFFFKIPF